MMKKSVWFLLSLGLVLALQGAAQTAPTEAQPQSQVPSALTKLAKPACPPPCLSAEQEAALVEVRKILKEARQVAEGITIPTRGLSTRESELKVLRDEKTKLVGRIEQAQFQAGDFSAAATTTQPWFLALTQVKHGHIQEGIQAAARGHLHEDSLLALVKALAITGHIQAAIRVVQTDLPKETVEHWRYRNEAAALALIAREQKRIGDQVVSETMQRALKAALAVKWPLDRYLAFVHVARAQAAMGDQTGSADSFRQAIQTALAIRRDATPAAALAGIAVAQAESGDAAGSAQTFLESIRLTNGLAAKEKAFRLVRTACSQVMRGQRESGQQTFQQALQVAETLSPVEKGRVLREIGAWQLKAGEREALAETLERAQKAGVDVADLAARAGYMQMALSQVESSQDVRWKIGSMRFFATLLVTISEQADIQPAALVKRFAKEAPLLAKETTFRDSQDAKFAAKDIAVIQAAAGDLTAVLRTIETISDESYLAGHVYPEVTQILTKQGNLAGARQVASSLKEDWIFGGTSEANNRDALRELAKLGARSGDVQGTLAWARKQPGPYARGYALLGVAEELMEQQRIEDIGKLLSETPLRGMSPCA